LRKKKSFRKEIVKNVIFGYELRSVQKVVGKSIIVKIESIHKNIPLSHNISEF